jgi:hypothetical protein
MIEDYQRRGYDEACSPEGPAGLVPRGTVTVHPGEALRRRAGVDVGRLAYAGTPVIAVIVSSRLHMALRMEYDLETLQPVRVIAGDVRSSRIEFTTKLLAQIGDSSSLPALRVLCGHRDYFVRWGAVRAIVAIDPQEGVKVLTAAMNDPNPHVVAAATAGLRQVAEALRTSPASPC